MDEEHADTGVEPPTADDPDGPAGGDLAESAQRTAALENRQAAYDAEFALFYTDQMPSLTAFLLVQGARAADAAEVAQETMIAAYRSWDSIDHPRAWVRTVASRTWWRRYQHDQAEDLSAELDERPPASTFPGIEEIESRHVFLGLLHSLPPGQRQVMAWTYDGYQPAEIAALLHLNVATVRSRLRDARAALRKRYRPDEEAP